MIHTVTVRTAQAVLLASALDAVRVAQQRAADIATALSAGMVPPGARVTHVDSVTGAVTFETLEPVPDAA